MKIDTQERVIAVPVPDQFIGQRPDGTLFLKGKWGTRLYGPDGKLKSERKWNNLITNEGLNLALNVIFGATAKPTFYVLLKSTGAVAAGDTMSSHAGWTEITSYDEAARQTAVFGVAASQAIDNAASVASFSMNATVSIYGAVLATNATKGGTTGTCFAGGNFSAQQDASPGDTLEVTVEYTGADDGI